MNQFLMVKLPPLTVWFNLAHIHEIRDYGDHLVIIPTNGRKLSVSSPEREEILCQFLDLLENTDA